MRTAHDYIERSIPTDLHIYQPTGRFITPRMSFKNHRLSAPD